MDSGFEDRAKARAGWPIHKGTLAEQGADDDLSATTTAEERIAMMWPLAMSAWSLTGKPLPSYTRAEMPAVLIRK